MTDYTKNTNFTAKDALTTGDPNKVIYGADFDAEFDELATAVATKANKVGTPVANNVLEMSASGDLVDTGHATPTGTFVGISDTQTLTNKTINLASNTVTGTTAEFNTSLSDDNFATIAGTETLTNKTLTSPAINGATINGASTIDSITATNLVDKSANETITGNWTLNGTVDFNDQVTKTVMLDTPETITISTTAGVGGHTLTATPSDGSCEAAIVRIRVRANATSSETSGTDNLNYKVELSSDGTNGRNEVIDLYWSIVSGDTTNTYNSQVNTATIQTDSSGNIDSLVSLSEGAGTGAVANKSISASLVGYIQKV